MNRKSINASLGMVAAVVAVLVCRSGDSIAQDTGFRDDSLRSVMQSDRASTSDLADRLEALITSTQQARQERQTDENTSEPVVGRPEPRPLGSDTLNRFGSRQESSSAIDQTDDSDSGQEAARSMSEIRERIRILQRLRRDRSYSIPLIPTNPPAPAQSTVNQNVVETDPLPKPVPQADSTPNADLSAIDQSLTASPPDAENSVEQSHESFPTSKLVLPNPVNAMALGENLYRTGNYESALKAFQSVDADTLSQSDRTWRDLLIALCQRKSGEYEKTNGTLRDIANDDSSDYPVKVAKWWLKYAEGTHAAQTQYDELSADLDALAERSKKYVAQ